jgi:hypothetical protein
MDHPNPRIPTSLPQLGSLSLPVQVGPKPSNAHTRPAGPQMAVLNALLACHYDPEKSLSKLLVFSFFENLSRFSGKNQGLHTETVSTSKTPLNFRNRFLFVNSTEAQLGLKTDQTNHRHNEAL